MPTILRATDQNRGVEAAAFNFDDMATQAGRYLEQVKAEAAKIVARAQQEAAQVRQQAEQQGRAVAMKSAEALIAVQLSTVLPALKQAIEEIRQARHAWLRQWEGQAVHVAAAMAKRVIRGELTRQPEIPARLVREALELASGSGEVRIHLNPADLKALGSQIQLVLSEIGAMAKAEVVPDVEIKQGGCRVETRFGTIDQQVETQLARIEEELG